MLPHLYSTKQCNRFVVHNIWKSVLYLKTCKYLLLCEKAMFLHKQLISLRKEQFWEKKLRLDDRSINLTHYQWLFKEGCDAVQTSSGWCRKCKIHMQKEESWISICASRLVAWCYSSFTRRLLPAPRTTTCFAILRGWRDSTQNMTTWYCITGRKDTL